jgi:hypothetical protein
MASGSWSCVFSRTRYWSASRSSHPSSAGSIYLDQYTWREMLQLFLSRISDKQKRFLIECTPRTLCWYSIVLFFQCTALLPYDVETYICLIFLVCSWLMRPCGVICHWLFIHPWHVSASRPSSERYFCSFLFMFIYWFTNCAWTASINFRLLIFGPSMTNHTSRFH